MLSPSSTPRQTIEEPRIPSPSRCSSLKKYAAPIIATIIGIALAIFFRFELPVDSQREAILFAVNFFILPSVMVSYAAHMDANGETERSKIFAMVGSLGLAIFLTQIAVVTHPNSPLLSFGLGAAAIFLYAKYLIHRSDFLEQEAEHDHTSMKVIVVAAAALCLYALFQPESIRPLALLGSLAVGGAVVTHLVAKIKGHEGLQLKKITALALAALVAAALLHFTSGEMNMLPYGVATTLGILALRELLKDEHGKAHYSGALLGLALGLWLGGFAYADHVYLHDTMNNTYFIGASALASTMLGALYQFEKRKEEDE